jgi:hypothetical protein
MRDESVQPPAPYLLPTETKEPPCWGRAAAREAKRVAVTTVNCMLAGGVRRWFLNENRLSLELVDNDRLEERSSYNHRHNMESLSAVLYLLLSRLFS